jgi:cytochrome d ubiquinol oxidase subunit II
MTLDLPMIWASLIAFAVLAHVLLDGFELGIGILFLSINGESNRDEAMNSVASVWDANETWLLLGGGGLLAVFPLAYAIIMSALYVPIIVMLLELVFRGVAFEFRWRTKRGQCLWDWAFAFPADNGVFLWHVHRPPQKALRLRSAMLSPSSAIQSVSRAAPRRRSISRS